ncbi:unnamed protein product, partial [Musa banksii]
MKQEENNGSKGCCYMPPEKWSKMNMEGFGSTYQGRELSISLSVTLCHFALNRKQLVALVLGKENCVFIMPSLNGELVMMKDSEAAFFQRLEDLQPCQVSELKPFTHIFAVYGYQSFTAVLFWIPIYIHTTNLLLPDDQFADLMHILLSFVP